VSIEIKFLGDLHDLTRRHKDVLPAKRHRAIKASAVSAGEQKQAKRLCVNSHACLQLRFFVSL
jgi:hypothetical protein